MDSVLQAGVISAPLQVIIDRLASFTVQETSQILGVDEEIRKLQRTLERIRALVGHVEENRSIFSESHSAEAWKVWLKDVEELLYSADDLLDGVSLDLLKHRASRSAADGEDKQVRDMLLSSFKLTVPREISRIRQELGDIAKEMDAIFMIEVAKLGTDDKKLKCRPVWRCSYSCARSSLVDEECVVGRDRERNEIVGMLLGQELSRTNVSVIPIVGMGGIGKTTLAQTVYNDHRLVGKFDLKMWASVSMDFDTIRVTKSIIESALGERCKLSGLDPIQVSLQNLIRGKKFLLVLDDYWSEEYRHWDMLCSPFKVGARGSMIILTTRSRIVSRILGTVPSYCLESLNDENCWELMKQRACANRTLEDNLERIGWMIAKKCRGLPLAAKTLGSMLHFKDDPAEWRSILESEILDLPQDKNDIFPALTLSYYHLPPQLKKCFTYCSIFPKSHAFEANELVLLWMAEGFVRPVGKIRPEDVGNDYFRVYCAGLSSNFHM
ncbi:putative disease resistance protein RGA3 [Sesamum angolense]|uniref:Disease resistance protein RGA3 n=1 Tax=Sesamum angolense TaxID=2727404 RepID=A0AAE2C0P0_9LAMI|nr:putative disease resistance protein RGA3 [Sesamum angolense]